MQAATSIVFPANKLGGLLPPLGSKDNIETRRVGRRKRWGRMRVGETEEREE